LRNVRTELASTKCIWSAGTGSCISYMWYCGAPVRTGRHGLGLHAALARAPSPVQTVYAYARRCRLVGYLPVPAIYTITERERVSDGHACRPAGRTYAHGLHNALPLGRQQIAVRRRHCTLPVVRGRPTPTWLHVHAARGHAYALHACAMTSPTALARSRTDRAGIVNGQELCGRHG
jgi:hypothetical protein